MGVGEEMKGRLAGIGERIDRACDAAGRDVGAVTLIAVSKTQPVSAIRELYDLGQRHFGESRLQEAQPKIEELPSDIVWHFIGKLQSNKARKVADLFDVIHTLESESQLKEVQKSKRRISGLIEINIAEEAQKSGIFPSKLDDFRSQVIHYDHVHLRGLMTIGPALDEPEQMRGYFRKARELNERIGGEWLSMGMSADFEVAVGEGATHIRVGTALFGERS